MSFDSWKDSIKNDPAPVSKTMAPITELIVQFAGPNAGEFFIVFHFFLSFTNDFVIFKVDLVIFKVDLDSLKYFHNVFAQYFCTIFLHNIFCR